MSDTTTSAPPDVTWDDLPLADRHRDELIRSGISPAVAADRGYRTVTKIRDVKQLGFAEPQCQTPGLLIPIYTVAGEIASYQYKPDAPRVKDGRVIKYESPPRSAPQLDVPPRARLWILDPGQPLLFTEGVKKGDAAASRGIACVSLAGVWNWRSPDVIAAFDQIPLKQRTAYLGYDSDAVRNASVREAKKRLAKVLRQHGAATTYDIALPEPTPGIKVGLDDYFASGGGPVDLFRLDMVELTDDADDKTAQEPEAGSYAATPNGIVYRRPTRDGPVDQPLSNFTAHIVEEVIADDGASERAELGIEGELGGAPLPRIRVPSRRFSSLDWVNSEWGARPIVNAGMGNRDRVREAIQRLSPDIERRHVYEHSGWRNLPGHGWCYLHAGGAIGAEGAVAGVDVALDGPASRITFPEPIDDDTLRAAFRAELALLDVSSDGVTVPLLGAVYRALLCEIVPTDTSPFLVGPTGTYKSELAARAMQHFGTGFSRLFMPADWTATANYLEKTAFNFKDALLVVDDFAPSGTQYDVARYHATAERVFRGAGNRGGRGRMNADGSLRASYSPRGIVGATGEDIPRGHSLRARLTIMDVTPDDVCLDGLASAQDAGQRGAFVGLLGRFIQSLARNFDELHGTLPARLTELRQRAHQGGAHARTPEAVANLALGWEQFLRFTTEAGLMTHSDAEATFDRVWNALGVVAQQQTSHQATEEPARRFIDLLGSSLAGGFAHVADPNGKTPFPFAPWGWREVTSGGGGYERTDWRGEGTRIGWVDGDSLYLDLDAALTVTQRVGQATGSGITVSPKTLTKRLHERGYLRSIDSERGRLHVRHTLQGARRNVLHLSSSCITPPEEPSQSSQSSQDTHEPTVSRHSSTGNGTVLWAGSTRTGPEPSQKTDPIPTEPRGNGSIGTVGTVFPERSGVAASTRTDAPDSWDDGEEVLL